MTTPQIGRCILTYLTMRAEPNGKSEMVSQVILGETYMVLENLGDWLFIENNFDGYRGYISAAQHTPDDFSQHEFSVYKKVSGRYNDRWATCGSEIIGEDDNQLSDLLELAGDFLHTPYLWGGRTFMGIDCSGLIQVLFKTRGITLKRDARDQVLQGSPVKFEERRSLDVCYFANESGAVIHTGILISEDVIIHAHGWVRMDTFDDWGIFNRDKNTYTHHLYSIRRFL